jgi:hypothetical protein
VDDTKDRKCDDEQRCSARPHPRFGSFSRHRRSSGSALGGTPPTPAFPSVRPPACPRRSYRRRGGARWPFRTAPRQTPRCLHGCPRLPRACSGAI